MKWESKIFIQMRATFHDSNWEKTFPSLEYSRSETYVIIPLIRSIATAYIKLKILKILENECNAYKKRWKN